MKRRSILTIFRLLSNSLAYLAMLVVAGFMLRRWLFLLAAWSPPAETSEVGKPSEAFPTVLLLVPFRNETAVLPTLLTHLDQLRYPAQQLTTLLIDDGSSDGSPQLAQAWVAQQPRRHLLRLPRTVGKAAALNAALAQFAQGELVAVLDADERPFPTTLLHLATHFANPRLGAINGRRAVGNPLASIFASVSAIENMVHQLVTMQSKERLGLAPALLGSNCVYRRQALADVGGFQPGALLEDSEITVRLALAGWQTRFCSQAVSVHDVAQTLGGYWRQHQRWSSGFGSVVRQQAAAILTRWQLPWRLRLELLAFSAGYADRAAWLLLGLWLGGKTAVLRRPPLPFLIILFTSLITPLFQAMVALRHAQAPAALWRRLWLLPCLLPLDMAIGLAGLLQKTVSWEAREQHEYLNDEMLVR